MYFTWLYKGSSYRNSCRKSCGISGQQWDPSFHTILKPCTLLPTWLCVCLPPSTSSSSENSTLNSKKSVAKTTLGFSPQSRLISNQKSTIERHFPNALSAAVSQCPDLRAPHVPEHHMGPWMHSQHYSATSAFVEHHPGHHKTNPLTTPEQRQTTSHSPAPQHCRHHQDQTQSGGMAITHPLVLCLAVTSADVTAWLNPLRAAGMF